MRLIFGKKLRTTEAHFDFTGPYKKKSVVSKGKDGGIEQEKSGESGNRTYSLGLDAESNVPIGITDSDESLEPGTLSGTSLLLDGHDLQNLILQAEQGGK